MIAKAMSLADNPDASCVVFVVFEGNAEDAEGDAVAFPRRFANEGPKYADQTMVSCTV